MCRWVWKCRRLCCLPGSTVSRNRRKSCGSNMPSSWRNIRTTAAEWTSRRGFNVKCLQVEGGRLNVVWVFRILKVFFFFLKHNKNWGLCSDVILRLWRRSSTREVMMVTGSRLRDRLSHSQLVASIGLSEECSQTLSTVCPNDPQRTGSNNL